MVGNVADCHEELEHPESKCPRSDTLVSAIYQGGCSHFRSRRFPMSTAGY